MDKTSTLWPNKLTSLICRSLEDKYRRPFVVHQGGPYPRMPQTLVELYFNDLILNKIRTDDPELTQTFKYGYRLRHLFDERSQCYRLWGGFFLQNKVVALIGFLDNLVCNARPIALELHKWISKKPAQSWLAFSISAESEYIWQPSDTVEKLAKELVRYGRVSHLKDLALPEVGIEFCCEREIKTVQGLSMRQLSGKSIEINKAAMKICTELDFLYYQLWPADRRDRVNVD